MKKLIKSLFLFFFILNIFFINKVFSAECRPAYNGNWTVTSSCSWPDGKKVYGNIYVGNYTITMGSNDDMGIDLNSKKITFGNGKINLSSTAKIGNHVSSRYYVSVSYGLGKTSCPSGMYVFNSSSAPNQSGTTRYLNLTGNSNPGPYSTSNSNVRRMPSTGRFYCGTKGS